jgi:hypothetical protein
MLILLWKIWDARNATVFRGELRTASAMLKLVIDELSFWLYLFKSGDQKVAATSWLDHLSLCNSDI